MGEPSQFSSLSGKQLNENSPLSAFVQVLEIFNVDDILAL